MTAEWAETLTARLSGRVSVEMTAGPGGFVCEWVPGVPRKLSAKEWKRYRQARHELLLRVAERMGGTVLLVEV
jgi:hypothetical protein